MERGQSISALLSDNYTSEIKRWQHIVESNLDFAFSGGDGTVRDRMGTRRAEDRRWEIENLLESFEEDRIAPLPPFAFRRSIVRSTAEQQTSALKKKEGASEETPPAKQT